MKRYQIKIYGIVQGVGFRPFVYKNAIKYQIKGYVKNCGSFVLLDIEGIKDNLDCFLKQILNNPPPLSKIEKVKTKALIVHNYQDFDILESSESEEKINFLSYDVAICNKCLNDIQNPMSRFYRYPFTNCTECGPRYSIIKNLPYDRKNTTMANFKFCSDCEDDYSNPLNRRFHAEPIACNNCGPTLRLLNNLGEIIESNDIIEYCSYLINQGKIIAIKGIGGFHLCCDAKNDQAVNRLREKKHRSGKSLAVMARNIDLIKDITEVSFVEEEVLTGPQKPITLLYKKNNNILSKMVAINNKYIGLFLPYTPLLYLLFENLDYYVMTSGNISNEPIIFENDQALIKLSNVADYFLMNDRDIYIPEDDSVVQVVNDEVMVLRLGRGYVPMTFRIESKAEILACGAEQKSSYAFSQNSYISSFQYLGDLKNYNTFQFYQDSLLKTITFFKLNPTHIVSDKNSGYLSSVYAKATGLEHIEVYHHHAHLTSCMGEHDLDENVIGIIFDGAGLGADNTSWGGEFLVGNLQEFTRVGNLKYVKIQGIDSAAHNIWKIALSYLYSINSQFVVERWDLNHTTIVQRALDANISCYLSSSIGRLFDCVSSLIGLREEVSYEGQAALELESIIVDSLYESYQFSILNTMDNFEVSYEQIINGIIEDLEFNTPQSIIATKFHNTVVQMIIEGAIFIRKRYNIKKIVLSGGVFQNRYLLSKSIRYLKEFDFDVYYNKKIPINDNGIAFGQIYHGKAVIKNLCV